MSVQGYTITKQMGTLVGREGREIHTHIHTSLVSQNWRIMKERKEIHLYSRQTPCIGQDPLEIRISGTLTLQKINS